MNKHVTRKDDRRQKNSQPSVERRQILRREEDRFVLQHQCEEIKHYILSFPEEERAEKELEWIEKYASTYRNNMDKVKDFVEKNLNSK